MEKANVAIIEDNERIRSIARRVLETANHTVVSEAATLDEAIDLVDQVATGELNVDVFLLDGKLRREAQIGEDAQIVSQRMQAQAIGGHVIGFSLSDLPPGVCHSAVENKDIVKAIDIINGLPEAS